jgi:hypothetical protein
LTFRLCPPCFRIPHRPPTARSTRLIRYALFVVLLGTALSSTVPLSLPCVALSCYSRYAIDRGYHLLRVYQRPAPVDATLIKLCVRVLPLGLLLKAAAMLLHYTHTTTLNDQSVALLVFGLGTLLTLMACYADSFTSSSNNREHSQVPSSLGPPLRFDAHVAVASPR